MMRASLPATRAEHWWPRARQIDEVLLHEMLLDARWQRVEAAFDAATAGFGTPVCHGPLHENGRVRFLDTIGPTVAEELLTSIATIEEAGQVVHVDHVLDARDVDTDPVQSILAVEYRCKGGLPGRSGVIARAWGLESRHLDPIAFRRRHRAMARAARRLVELAWPLTTGEGPAPVLRLHPGLDAGVTAAYVPERHVVDLWLDDYVARDLLDQQDGPDLAITLLHELAHAATPWRVRPFEPDGRDRAAVAYIEAMKVLDDPDEPIDHVLVFGLAGRYGSGRTVEALRVGGIDHHALTALNESLTDLWAQELLVELGPHTDLPIVRHARPDDRSAYRPGRAVVQHLLGAVPASVIATADEPLGAMLVSLEGDGARLALLRAIHVPQTADELDGPRSRMLASCFARIEAAMVSDV